MKARHAGFLAAGTALLLDQVTKAAALAQLDVGTPVSLIGKAVQFTLRFNSGAAFSLKWGGPLFLTIFTGVAVLAVLWLLVARPPRLPLHAASFGLILGGASGNLLDRLLHSGAVVDFLDVGTASWRWPTFNVADAAISIGAVVLLLFGPKGKRIEGE
jgi:signal peptidase II